MWWSFIDKYMEFQLRVAVNWMMDDGTKKLWKSMLNIILTMNFCKCGKFSFDVETSQWVVATLQPENPHHSQSKNAFVNL